MAVSRFRPIPVMPAKAGIQFIVWTPASAGVTGEL
jgi:hypothetical protein